MPLLTGGSMVALVACVAMAERARSDPPRLINLGMGSEFSQPLDVSYDGSAVVGSLEVGDVHQAVSWRVPCGGGPPIRFLGFEGTAFFANADASAVLGGDPWRVWRWTAATGPHEIQAPPGADLYELVGLSDDGRRVMWQAYLRGVSTYFLWTSDSGGASGSLTQLTLPPLLASLHDAQLSGQGTVLVGGAPDASRRDRAVWWSLEEGASLLPVFAHGMYSTARCVTPDGSIVAGLIESERVLWIRDRQTGHFRIRRLGPAPAGMSVGITAISGNGAVVGGRGFVSGQRSQAVIWTQRTGFITLSDHLRDLGADPSDWLMSEVRSISANGSTLCVAAETVSPRRYTALAICGLPSVHPCAADVNSDGIADMFDYHDFVARFEAGDPEADFLPDGFVDFFDYLEFVTAFEIGC